MFAAMYGLSQILWPFQQALKISALDAHLAKAGAEPWHGYAIRNWRNRPHVCLACAWLGKILPKDAKIFEAGCGSGINLLWLGNKGFRNLNGADVSPQAVALARSLASSLHINLNIWQDDSLAPGHIPKKIEGLISLNWLYHLPKADLADFLTIYRPFLAPKAKAAFDMVDASYNSRKNNAWHSGDSRLPPEQRRPSEYTLRLSRQEIRSIAEKQGFRILKYAKVWGAVPRTVWLLEYEASA